MALAAAPRHTLLTLTGGSIGQGMPVATGAAIAAPDRPVLSLEADGSALYTIQALWTQAREQLDVTTVLINNAAYAILRMELARTLADQTGAGQPGERADARPVPPHPGFHPDQHRPRRARDARHHGRRTGHRTAARLRRTRPAPDRGHGSPGVPAPLGHGLVIGREPP